MGGFYQFFDFYFEAGISKLFLWITPWFLKKLNCYREKPPRNREKPSCYREKPTCYRKKTSRYREKMPRNREKLNCYRENTLRYREKMLRYREKIEQFSSVSVHNIINSSFYFGGNSLKYLMLNMISIKNKLPVWW